MANSLLDFLQSASNTAADTVAAPVDLLAMALRKAGVPITNPVGGTQWMTERGLRRDVKQSPASLAGETMGLLSPVVAAAKAPQIARGLLQHAEDFQKYNRALGPAGASQAIVWQGSPHKYDPEKLVRLADGTMAYVGGKFNKLQAVPPGAQVVDDFPLGRIRSEAIGTGEGAQAYGHGSYLAEAQGVGNSYRRAGETAAPIQYKGQGIMNWAIGNRDAAKALPKETQDALAWARDHVSLDDAYTAAIAYDKPAIEKEIQRLVRAGDLTMAPEGHLYKVDLPDNMIARMLDWDKPLSQQPGLPMDVFGLAQRNSIRTLPSSSAPLSISPAIAQDMASNKTGSTAYQMLVDTHGPNGAAMVLRRSGVPGIRYLDGGSRGAGAGTSNFVVFPGEENALRILERNGLLAP